MLFSQCYFFRTLSCSIWVTRVKQNGADHWIREILDYKLVPLNFRELVTLFGLTLSLDKVWGVEFQNSTSFCPLPFLFHLFLLLHSPFCLLTGLARWIGRFEDFQGDPWERADGLHRESDGGSWANHPQLHFIRAAVDHRNREAHLRGQRKQNGKPSAPGGLTKSWIHIIQRSHQSWHNSSIHDGAYFCGSW